MAETLDLSQQFSSFDLGQGIQTSTRTITPFSCVEISSSNTQASTQFIVKSDYQEIETIEELKKITKGGLILNDLFEAKLQKNLSSSSKNKIIKITLSFLQKQLGKTTYSLNKNYETLIRNGQFIEFANNCGTEYITSIAKGHKLHIFMILSSSEEQMTKELEATIKLNITQLLSKLSGAETIEQLLGKLELTASLMQKLEQLSKSVQLEYTISMTGAGNISKDDKLVSMGQAPIQTGINDQFSETGNSITQLLLLMTKNFPKYAINELNTNAQSLPQVEASGESYSVLLGNSYFGKKLGELNVVELLTFQKTLQEFNFFKLAFKKIETRYSQLDILLSKALKIQKEDDLHFLRLKAFKAIIKYLQINKQSMENIIEYCQSSSLVYSDCKALALGSLVKDNQVKSAFLQTGNNFTCMESNDFNAIEMCLNQAMEPASCKRIAFSEYNLAKETCEKSSINYLETFILPVQPETM